MKKSKAWSRKKKVLVFGGGALILLIGIVGSQGGNNDVAETIAAPTEVTEGTEVAAVPVEKASEPAEQTEIAAEPEVPLEYANAARAAESYLATMAFSRKGLGEQLAYEGYPEEAIEYALAEMDKGVDWDGQAYSKAQSYLEFQSFSRAGLLDQLLYEGFTQEQAEYGVNKTFE